MRLIDLEQLKFVNKNKNEIQIISVEWITELSNVPYKEGFEALEKLCKEAVEQITQDEVYFEININDKTFNKGDRSNYALFVGNLLVSLITKNELREREPRLNIPKHLEKKYGISRITLLKVINNKSAVRAFGGRICINGKNFYLLGS